MTELRFRSPTGIGVAVARVHERSGVEFVEIEVELVREIMSDLGFTEEPDATTPNGQPTPLMPESSSSQVHDPGPAEGRGLDCPERVVDGRLRGACLDPKPGGIGEGSDA